MDININEIYKCSRKNKKTIQKSKICGCYYCLKIFKNSEIKNWVKDGNDYTALCPYCGIDSVICDNKKNEITYELLKKLNEYWF